jgi:phosphatidylglycerophosphate synthase
MFVIENRYTFRQVTEKLVLRSWWASVAVLPLSNRLILLVINHTRISPNQITLTALFLRLFTAGCFITGDRVWLVAGALCYHLAYVCDCADGTVARLTGQTSELGRYLDHVADLLGDLLILAALSWSLGLLTTPMIIAMLFMQVAECYISYLAGFAIAPKHEPKSSNGLFNLFNCYRDWWFRKNIKSCPSFPDYCAFVFVICPLFNRAETGLRIGFFFLLFVCLYTVLSTFVSIHTGRRYFP